MLNEDTSFQTHIHKRKFLFSKNKRNSQTHIKQHRLFRRKNPESNSEKHISQSKNSKICLCRAPFEKGAFRHFAEPACRDFFQSRNRFFHRSHKRRLYEKGLAMSITRFHLRSNPENDLVQPGGDGIADAHVNRGKVRI